MKKAIVIIFIVLVLAVAAWFFFFKDKKEVLPASVANTPPVKDVVPGIPGPLPTTVSAVSDPVGIHNGGEVITVSTIPLEVPTLTSLRAKKWSGTVYKGTLDPDDLYELNQVLDFAPISNPVTLIGYNSQPDFQVKKCTSPSSCEYVTISKKNFPFALIYSSTPEYSGYLSSDLTKVLLVRGGVILKEITESTGSSVLTGETSASIQIPSLSLLSSKEWDVQTTYKLLSFSEPWKSKWMNWNIFSGESRNAQVAYNTDREFTPELVSKDDRGFVTASYPYIVGKDSFPFKISYPGYNDASYVSSDLSTILFTLGPGNPSGIWKIFKLKK